MKKRLMAFLFALILILVGCAEQALSQTDELQQVAVLPSPTLATAEQTVLPMQPTNAVQPEFVVDPYVPYTFESMISDAQELEEMYPQHIELSSIGSSVEGRDLTLIKMGSGEIKLLLVGAHHAREYISSTYLMNTIDKYLYAAANEQMFGEHDIASLLEQVTVYIVPMINPDGVNLAINGIDSVADVTAVSNMTMIKSSYAEWKANINGVDLNRQYPCFWEVKASNTFMPSSELYKGEDSATEPEVKAMMALCGNNDFELAVSFHTKGEIIYWADSGTADNIPDAERVTDAVAAVSGYKKISPSKDPAVYAAGFENWFRQEFSKPGLCIELTPSDGTSAPHDDSEFDEVVWDNAQFIAAVLMSEALK